MPTRAPALRIIEVLWLAQLRPGDRILRIDDHRYRPELTVVDALAALGEQPGDRGVRCRSAGGAEVLLRPVECSHSLIVVREDPAQQDTLTRRRAPSAREKARHISTAPERTEGRASTPDEHPFYRLGQIGDWSA